MTKISALTEFTVNGKIENISKIIHCMPNGDKSNGKNKRGKEERGNEQ